MTKIPTEYEEPSKRSYTTTKPITSQSEIPTITEPDTKIPGCGRPVEGDGKHHREAHPVNVRRLSHSKMYHDIEEPEKTDILEFGTGLNDKVPGEGTSMSKEEIENYYDQHLHQRPLPNWHIPEQKKQDNSKSLNILPTHPLTSKSSEDTKSPTLLQPVTPIFSNDNKLEKNGILSRSTPGIIETEQNDLDNKSSSVVHPLQKEKESESESKSKSNVISGSVPVVSAGTAIGMAITGSMVPNAKDSKSVKEPLPDLSSKNTNSSPMNSILEEQNEIPDIAIVCGAGVLANHRHAGASNKVSSDSTTSEGTGISCTRNVSKPIQAPYRTSFQAPIMSAASMKEIGRQAPNMSGSSLKEISGNKIMIGESSLYEGYFGLDNFGKSTNTRDFITHSHELGPKDNMKEAMENYHNRPVLSASSLREIKRMAPTMCSSSLREIAGRRTMIGDSLPKKSFSGMEVLDSGFMESGRHENLFASSVAMGQKKSLVTKEGVEEETEIIQSTSERDVLSEEEIGHTEIVPGVAAGTFKSSFLTKFSSSRRPATDKQLMGSYDTSVGNLTTRRSRSIGSETAGSYASTVGNYPSLVDPTVSTYGAKTVSEKQMTKNGPTEYYTQSRRSSRFEQERDIPRHFRRVSKVQEKEENAPTVGRMAKIGRRLSRSFV